MTTPADFSGKALWLRAKDLGTGSVSTWADQSGLGNDATSTGTAPTVATASTPNGGKSVRFPGTGSFIGTALPMTTAILTATASSQSGGTTTPDRAVDGSSTTQWIASGAAPQWLRVEPTASTTATSYAILPPNNLPNQAPRDWTFEGSNDGSSWTTLDTRSGETFTNQVERTFTFSNSTAYTYYRLNITATTSGSPGVAELKLNGTASTPTQNDAEMWIVVKSDGGSAPQSWDFGSAAASNHYTFGGVVYDDFGHATRRQFTPSMSVTSTFRVYRVAISGTTWTAWIDGVQQAQFTGVTKAHLAGPYQLGRGGSTGTAYFQGNIAEVLVRSGVSDTTEAAALLAYFQTEHIDVASAATGTVSAAASAPSVSIVGAVAEPPTTGTVNATASAPTVSITGDVAGAAVDVTGTVNATASHPTLSVTGESGEGGAPIGFGFGFGMRITQRRNHLTDPRTNLPQYRLVAVDMYGTPMAELHKASMGALEDEVNGAGGFSFTVASSDPKARMVMPRHGSAPPEVQVWRGDMLVGWYVVKTARPTGQGLYTFDCVGLRWLYSRRFIDRRPRRFLFRNGTFGSGLKWWDTATASGTITAAVVTSDRGIDGKAVRLTNAGTNVYGRSGPTARHLRQRRRITQPVALQAPLPIRATLDMRVESFGAPSLLGYAVRLIAVSVNDLATIVDTDEVEMGESYLIDADTPRDRWHEITLEVEVPANGVEHIVELRLVPPGTGVAEFTNIDVSPAEQLAYFDDDQAWIVGNLSDNAQDPTWGKASLNIGRHTPLTGVLRSREYEFADHKPYLDAMQEFPALHNGVEWDIATTATTRTLTTFYPRQGGPSDAVLALGGNVIGYDATIDLDDVSNSVIVQGMTLGGSDRKERHATDPASMNGAVLESVVMADGETPLPELGEVAAQVLAEMGSPAPPLRVSCHPRATSDLLDRLGKGDSCRAIVGDGLLDVDGTHRVMRRTLDPNTDSLTYDLTREV